jgi:hypothetical protein
MTDGWKVGDAVAAQHRGGGSDAAASGDAAYRSPRPSGRPAAKQPRRTGTATPLEVLSKTSLAST